MRERFAWQLGPGKPSRLFGAAPFLHMNDHLSTNEAAAMLGMSPAKLRVEVRADRIPAIVVGGNIRIARDTIEERMTAGSTPAKDLASATIVEALLGRPITDLPMLLSVEQVSDMLGITARAARNAMASGELPCLVVGKRRHCPTAALVSLLARVRAAA
jgi:excisionase family DNA binding protein